MLYNIELVISYTYTQNFLNLSVLLFADKKGTH